MEISRTPSPSRASAVSLLLLLFFVSWVCPPAAAAAGEELAKPAAAGGERLFVTATTQGYFVDRAEGPRLRLDLPAGARLEDFAADARGWTAVAIDSRGPQPKLLLLQSVDGVEERLPSPAFEDREILASARLLAGPKGLVGLAWLEGDHPRRLAVRAARFEKGAWSEPATVAPPGPGSQAGLAAARLAGGSSLLAWSAFDGEDDEILWSHLAGGRWSEPRRACCENRVPDITPTLVADGERGALLAFSHFDGSQYRVMLARFDGESWGTARPVGPRGSVRPRLETLEGEAMLLYRRPARATWTVAELAAGGEITRRADLPVASTATPALARRVPGGLEISNGGELARVDWRGESPDRP